MRPGRKLPQYLQHETCGFSDFIKAHGHSSRNIALGAHGLLTGIRALSIVALTSAIAAAWGLWQIRGRSNLSFDDMVRYDQEYVRNWSLFLDLIILAKTPVLVLRGDGAY